MGAHPLTLLDCVSLANVESRSSTLSTRGQIPHNYQLGGVMQHVEIRAGYARSQSNYSSFGGKNDSCGSGVSHPCMYFVKYFIRTGKKDAIMLCIDGTDFANRSDS